MKSLLIDIETYSSRSLQRCGLYAYAAAPDFEVLLFGYSVDGGEPETVDLARGEKIPGRVAAALSDPAVIKRAYNAAFERVCLSRHLGLKPGAYLDAAGWSCTMVQAARCGFPMGLDACVRALGLKEGKDAAGRSLLKKFCLPQAADRRRVRPEDDPEGWELFRRYNLQDVRLEMEIHRRTARLDVTRFDDALYRVDQAINDRGVRVDRGLCEGAAFIDDNYKAMLARRMRMGSGATRVGDALTKSLDAAALARLRHERARVSTSKFAAALRVASNRDDRCRGLLQFYGATRTGRWSGRLVQVQNMPPTGGRTVEELRRIRSAARAGDVDAFHEAFPDTMDALSSIVRTAFVPADGREFLICDFSQVEARVLAWLAWEEWALEAYRDGRDVYRLTAAKMYGVSEEEVTAAQRHAGKTAALALGYGGGAGALERAGPRAGGLDAKGVRLMVAAWRATNRRTVALWESVESAARAAIRLGERQRLAHGLSFDRQWGCLLVTLPSGRVLCYPRARATGREIFYQGLSQGSAVWGEVATYGGKLVENIVQAVARDLLGEALIACDKRGLEVVFHVHDEIVAEVDRGFPLEPLRDIFRAAPSWAKDLPLEAECYRAPFYMKK